MKIIGYEQDIKMNIKSEAVNHLVIENPALLYSFVMSIERSYNRSCAEVDIVVDENSIDFRKHTSILFSPMDCIYEKKDIHKKLYQELVETIEESSLQEKFISIKANMVDIISELATISDFDITYDVDWNFETLIKVFNIKLNEPEGSFAAKLIEFAQNIHRILGKKIIILIGCADYLDETNYIDIIKAFSYEGLVLLMIDGKQLNPLQVDVNEHIIDRDLCVI